MNISCHPTEWKNFSAHTFYFFAAADLAKIVVEKLYNSLL